MSYSSGEISKLTGLTVYTLRYYEKIGLINICKNGKNRIYSEDDLKLINYINSLKELGFSLEEIKIYTVLKKDDQKTLKLRKNLLDNHLKVLNEKIKSLNVLKMELEAKLDCIKNRINDEIK